MKTVQRHSRHSTYSGFVAAYFTSHPPLRISLQWYIIRHLQYEQQHQQFIWEQQHIQACKIQKESARDAILPNSFHWCLFNPLLSIKLTVSPPCHTKISTNKTITITTIKYEVICSITIRHKKTVYTAFCKGAELKNGLNCVLRPLLHCDPAWFFPQSKLNPANSSGLNFRIYTPLSFSVYIKVQNNSQLGLPSLCDSGAVKQEQI